MQFVIYLGKQAIINYVTSAIVIPLIVSTSKKVVKKIVHRYQPIRHFDNDKYVYINKNHT